MRKRLTSAWAIAAGLILTALAGAGWMVQSRSQEQAVISRARGHFEAGRSEAAIDVLHGLRPGPLSSSAGRREAAELYFLLGEDERGHDLLRRQRLRMEDPADRRLGELAARCRRAAELLERAETTADAEERVRLAEAARRETPGAPGVLERLVQEELLALPRTANPDAMSRFERDYRELRVRAPRLSDSLKQRVAATIASLKP